MKKIVYPPLLLNVFGWPIHLVDRGNFPKNILTLLIIVVFGSLILPNGINAQFQGHLSKGGWGLQSGSQMSEGLVIAPLYVNYSADKLMNKDGDEARNITGANRSLSVNGVGLFVWWVSEYKILGANYGVIASLPYLGNSLEFASKDFKTKFGLGDFYLQPVNFGWHFEQLDVMASYGVYFPTGRYDAEANDNTGLGMWTHELGGGATVFFDQEKNWHLSALADLEFHSKKKDTEIKVGNILTLQGGAGRSFYEGALMFGVSYYMQWKLSKDKIDVKLDHPKLPDVITLDNKHSVYALGPDVTVPIVIKEKLIALVTARYQWEFGAKTNLQGNMLNVFVQFPVFTGGK